MAAGRETSTNPHSAPTSGRVNKVSATTEAPAIPTITTHLKHASSEIFISPAVCLKHGRENQAGRWTQGAR